jgi:hypothetical protein
MVGLIVDLAEDRRRLDDRIATVSAEIEALAGPNSAACLANPSADDGARRDRSHGLKTMK